MRGFGGRGWRLGAAGPPGVDWREPPRPRGPGARADRRRPRRRPSRSARAAGAALLLAGSFASGWRLAPTLLENLAVARPGLLALRRIAVVGCATLAPAEIAALAPPAGTPLPELDRLALVEHLTRHPWIAAAQVLRFPPETLVIGVEERVPVAVTGAGPRGEPFLVDRDGVPFAPAEAGAAEGLLRLVLDPPATPRQGDTGLRDGLRVAEALAAHDLPAAEEIRLGPAEPAGTRSLRLRGLAALILLGADDLEGGLGRLARLLAADLEEVEQAEGIDLRFQERAILRFSPPRTGADQRRSGAEARFRPIPAPSGASGGTDQRGGERHGSQG